MSFENLLNQLCSIQSKTDSQTATGQVSSAWVDKATNVKTRMVAQKNPQVFGTLGHYTVADFKFYFLTGTDITEADRIVLNGETYDVVIAYPDSSGHHIEVGANKVSFK
jgi:head-tail adaptor